MVLLVLALVWGALLVSWLRSRSVNTFGDSVGTFRRHLTVLERTTPTTVRPANRLRGGAAGPARTAPTSIRGTRIEASPTRSSAALPAAAGRPGPSRLSRPVAGDAAALRRRQAQKRRRDVFFALLAGAAGSFLLALIPGMSILWSVQVLFDVLLGSYVTLLIRLRNLAAERELKLRFIPANRAQVRQRHHELNPAYDFGAGYGDLELRRAAN